MSSKQYRPWNPDQLLLFPPAMRDALDDGHIVFSIMDVVGTLDISCVTDRIQERDPRGTRPYHPDNAGAAHVRLLQRHLLLSKLVSAQQAAACP